jgi:nucleoporin NUP42
VSSYHQATQRSFNTNNHSWGINVADVQTDLTAGKGRPQWILSTYAPGKDPPASLLDGNELSFEELRKRFYGLKAEGNEAQAVNEASELWSKAEQQITDILSNVDKVVPFMEDADKKHPNRYDFLKMSGTTSKEQVVKEATASNPFGGTAGSKPSAFGATASGLGTGFGGTGISGFDSASKTMIPPSGALGQPPSSTFGTPSFGQPSQPAFGQSSFGQPSTTSTFGKPSIGAFGQPSTLGQLSKAPAYGASAFGHSAAKTPFTVPSAATFGHFAAKNPSIVPSAATFGHSAAKIPSTLPPAATFGQPSNPAPAFGQTSQPTSGFGQPSQIGGFGTISKPSSGFGQASQLGGGFGQPSKPTTAFGPLAQPSSTFGQPSQPVSSSNPPSKHFSAFSQPVKPATGFSQPFPPTPAFGQPSQPTSGFGQAAQRTATFGQPSNPVTGFGQLSQPKTAKQDAPAFSQPLVSQATNTNPSNPFGDGTTTSNTFSRPSQPPSGPRTDRPNPFITTSPSSTAPTLVNSPSPAPPSQSAPAPSTSTTTTTQTPHPLSSQPPVPTHYTQTLALGRTQSNPTTKRLTTYKSHPVKYIHNAPCYERPDGRGWERIWFPEGVETVRVEDIQPPEEKYEEKVVDAWRSWVGRGRFELEKMPSVAPRREWVGFDF